MGARTLEGIRASRRSWGGYGSVATIMASLYHLGAEPVGYVASPQLNAAKVQTTCRRRYKCTRHKGRGKMPGRSQHWGRSFTCTGAFSVRRFNRFRRATGNDRNPWCDSHGSSSSYSQCVSPDRGLSWCRWRYVPAGLLLFLITFQQV